jgi:rare lipoprotein A
VPQRRGGYYLDDGPGDHPPANLAQIPDAEPKVEPLSRYGNNPYVVFGREYVPDRSYRRFRQRGTASWYGRRFHGQRTSSGEAYDMYAMTAAHPTLPIPSYAKVTNVANGRSVVVRINDRGPFLHGRVIDLSYVAAWKLGYIEQGSALVELEALPVTRPQTVTAPTESKPAQQARQPTSLSSATEAAGIYVQLAAFAARETAESARARLALELAALDRAIEIYPKDGLFRLHVGPYRSRSEADAIADQLGKALESKPQIVIR